MTRRAGKQSKEQKDQPDNGFSVKSMEEIIKQTGIINKAESTESPVEDPDYIFPAVLYTIPLTSFYICMDVLLHKQFFLQVEHGTRYPSFCLVLLFLVFLR
jgi:hypothetical protein